MPVTPTYPGVYVQEVPSGVRTIVGVSTSVGMFIGASKKGPMSSPVRCVNYSAFRDKFGDDSSAGSLAQYVKLFFLNGGTDCYVMRIAQGASASTVTLKSEAQVDTLRLTAKDLGATGENIRALVTYNGAQPEVTFNLELFTWEIASNGARSKKAGETWPNLTMDRNSPSYAPSFITQNSKLVDATDLNLPPAPRSKWGFSLSGRAVPEPVSFLASWGALLGTTSTTKNRFKISVGGTPYFDVDLRTVVVSTSAALATSIAGAINAVFANKGFPAVTVGVSLVPSAAGNRLKIEGLSGDNGNVFIRPGDFFNGQGDVAAALMLGTEQGGLEIGAFADLRPAPTGITFSAATPANVIALGDLAQSALTNFNLIDLDDVTGLPSPAPIPLQTGTPKVVTGVGADLVVKDAIVGSPNGNSDGVREKLAIMAKLINAYAPPVGKSAVWKAESYGYRLAILPVGGTDDNFLFPGFAPVNAATAARFIKNVHYYTLGAGGLNAGGFQVSSAAASDGTVPLASDYDDAYEVIDKEVDIFNLMILTPVAGEVVTPQSLYGDASIFCQSRRAFLLMDPPSTWSDAQTASTGIAALRVGLVKDYSALFFPRITISDSGIAKNIGPAGAVAGLFARIDGTRGVWKAPAGTEADLRGIIGLEQRFSDGENGILNPKAVNTLRIFPNGIVSWGARTMDGDDGFGSEYKYIPVRRLALYMEESLYRGLKWAVFEPNDEPLWSQIRLNVGAFMHNLFRQGAFQGRTPKDAYFVKCDAETTTHNDRNLGIVNVWVGFAPLKPAEFVILYLQQMAGQIET